MRHCNSVFSAQDIWFLLDKDDEIIINEAEHASNILPWYEVAKRKEAKVIFAPLNDEGKVTLENIKKVVTSKTQ